MKCMWNCSDGAAEVLGVETGELAWRTGPSARLLPSRCSFDSSQAGLSLLLVSIKHQTVLSSPTAAPVSTIVCPELLGVFSSSTVLIYLVNSWPTHEPQFLLICREAISFCLCIGVTEPENKAVIDGERGKRV